MALPRILKNMNLFNEGQTYLGQAEELTPPKISHKMEEYRGGGMIGAVMIDQGLEAMELESTFGGHVTQFVRQMGAGQHDGVLLRAFGAYQSDDTGNVSSVQLVMRGRHQEIDRGGWKPGDKGEFKIKSPLSYYKEIVDGVELLEIDQARGIYRVGGVDRYADIRRAIGG